MGRRGGRSTQARRARRLRRVVLLGVALSVVLALRNRRIAQSEAQLFG